ncbi:class I SAM-dependent methyltransferase [Streptomyces sp. PTM05]|uniref:Class I SAM-dependent methyltransferase n=1 Tax=Streptantibioticus parmotrematis TaxID=2873249 RepID=A0ABS7QSF0_9ACTN|nr:class I SAM-dependent methyltransferase [Streptantibioticus parmotrematis]MBY8884747.1 class I SAM-dependent methyltransferase [Streptantibioticus parmotrematis]
MGVRQQYDGIGEAFEGFKALPLARYGEVPGFLAMVGDVRGKAVLDLASGTGFYSREFAWRGAADVLGIDISGEMVSVARESEEREPLGVNYQVGDVAQLPPLGRRFDVATAVQLFGYADTVDAFERMCRNIHASLKPGAEFFAFNQRPDYRFDGPRLDKYGFRAELTGTQAETGPGVRITALLAPRPIAFTATLPRREVYETCLRAAGFSDVTWVPIGISDAGTRAFGADFWADAHANPPLVMLRCRA